MYVCMCVSLNHCVFVCAYVCVCVFFSGEFFFVLIYFHTKLFRFYDSESKNRKKLKSFIGSTLLKSDD